MMEIYEVLNQVHSEEEYMEFPEMETAAVSYTHLTLPTTERV